MDVTSLTHSAHGDDRRAPACASAGGSVPPVLALPTIAAASIAEFAEGGTPVACPIASTMCWTCTAAPYRNPALSQR